MNLILLWAILIMGSILVSYHFSSLFSVDRLCQGRTIWQSFILLRVSGLLHALLMWDNSCVLLKTQTPLTESCWRMLMLSILQRLVMNYCRQTVLSMQICPATVWYHSWERRMCSHRNASHIASLCFHLHCVDNHVWDTAYPLWFHNFFHNSLFYNLFNYQKRSGAITAINP